VPPAENRFHSSQVLHLADSILKVGDCYDYVIDLQNTHSIALAWRVLCDHRTND
jgi:hypothetical protein